MFLGACCRPDGRPRLDARQRAMRQHPARRSGTRYGSRKHRGSLRGAFAPRYRRCALESASRSSATLRKRHVTRLAKTASRAPSRMLRAALLTAGRPAQIGASCPWLDDGVHAAGLTAARAFKAAPFVPDKRGGARSRLAVVTTEDLIAGTSLSELDGLHSRRR